MKIVFFGTSAFAAGVLEFLSKQSDCTILGVVTRPDRPRGRALEVLPSPVKEQASRSLGSAVPVFQPIKASTPEFAITLKNLNADLFLVVAYGEIIKQEILDLPTYGCINIHASLLPQYRGAAPIQRCIMNGEKESGITIIEMVKAMDAGPMLKKKSVPISENMTFGELEKDLLEAACKAALETIRDFAQGCITKIEQDHSLATYAAKLSPEDERIDWRRSAQAIHDQIRALSPFPGAWCRVKMGSQEKRLKIKKSLVKSELVGEPGAILEHTKHSLVIGCGDRSLQLLEVQLEGKRNMTIQEFLQGMQQHLQIVQ